jgi:2-keto-4-pentenoate hydratase/2-oxohepta-3-ene-1,7-dioic acid hydratase in catechol pathway
MKIVKFYLEGRERYGILEKDSISIAEGNPFEDLKLTSSYLPLNSVRLLPPVEPPNIVCIGLNYRRHAMESKSPVPEVPQLFLKPTTTIIGHEDQIVLPEMDPDKVDYEAELAIVIGKRAKYVPEEKALEYIAGYTCANDVSARGCQFRDIQWTRGKSFDTFCPIGPVIETDIKDPDLLRIQCRLNSRVVQDSNTSDMIFSVREIISFVSRCFTLLPGTLILTGTPEGVGFARNPPVFLRDGDVVEVEIDRIGILRNTVKRVNSEV